MTDLINNELILIGTIISPFRFDHMEMGENFYEFLLASKRKSENVDKIRVMISERLNIVGKKGVGDRIAIRGQLRTHNDNEGRLKIYAFVKEIIEDSEQDKNDISLTGCICKQPVYRKTPLGREITDVLLAVNRRYNKSDYLPTIFWGRNAKFVGDMPVGTKIHMRGRVQSRIYYKQREDGEKEAKTAYEISANTCEEI